MSANPSATPSRAAPRPRSGTPLFSKLRGVVRAQLFAEQVLIEFPIEELRKRADALNSLPPGYSAIIPSTPAHFEAWAALLNEEPSFGHWTTQRIRDELLAELVPNAALTIWHQQRAIACACAIRTGTASWRVATGMYLYVTPKYRRRADIAYATTYGMLYECVKSGYDQVVATTDPSRLSALALYLSNGSRPVRNTLIGWYRWRGILKRLGPTLAKMRERRARQAVAPSATSSD